MKEDSGEKIVNEATDQNEAHKSYAIERLIIRFPEVVRAAEKNLAPHTVAQYLTQLASEWNSFYAQERIIGSDDEAYKLEIARVFITTMENGLHLLGISVPEKM